MQLFVQRKTSSVNIVLEEKRENSHDMNNDAIYNFVCVIILLHHNN